MVEVVYASEILINGQAVCYQSFENFENQNNGVNRLLHQRAL